MPTGYRTKTQVFEYVREKTGYGRRVVEKKMDELAREGTIKLIPDPGNKLAILTSDADVEKIIQALSLP